MPISKLRQKMMFVIKTQQYILLYNTIQIKRFFSKFYLNI